MRSLSAPPAVRWVVRTLEEAGFETWAVGGAVRDVLAGRPSVDWDFATRARPPEVRRVFRRTVPVGIEHGTVGVLARDGTMYEVTTFRKDVETFGRHAVVEFADSLDEDLSRRDFTINAVAWHPLEDEVHDPFGGVEDLRRGVLRTVGEPADRFAEDWLRVLRALRFAGLFELEVDPPTWRALADAVVHLPELSPERVREELVKVLSADPRPSRALGLYAESGALGVAWPELAAQVGRGAPDDEGPADLWTRAVAAADILPRSRPVLRLAALLHDGGVADEVPGQGRGRAGQAGAESGPGEGAAPDVRERGARRAAALMTRLRFSNADTDRVVHLVRVGAVLPPASAGGAERRRWLARVGSDRVADVVRLAGARARVADRLLGDGAGRAAAVAASARRVREELRGAPALEVGDLALDGGDLIRMGLRPGPRFGEILEALLERVLEEPGLNDPATLAGLVRREVAPELFDRNDTEGAP